MPISVLTRRHLLQTGLALTVGALCPSLLHAATPRGRRQLHLVNLHTNETLRATYWENGRYLADELDAINWLLRDFRAGEQFPIERSLLDLLFEMQRTLNTTRPFQVISGYRSPATNAQLHAQGHGVAKSSLHTRGQAIDIRLANRNLTQVHEAARHQRRGGVGFYPRSNFVHVDVGRVRYWQGV